MDDKEGGIAERRKADILQYLTDTPKAASKEIAEAVGLQVSRTKMYLAELIEQEDCCCRRRRTCA